MAAERILTAREYSLIVEGLIRITVNGEEFAGKEDLNQETRDGYAKDAREARALREAVVKNPLSLVLITD